MSRDRMKPVAVLIHVPDVLTAFEWYGKAFPSSRVSRPASRELAVLDIDGFDLEIVRADDKVASGKGGTVLYWRVPSIAEAMDRLARIGATLYRGPIPVEDGSSMCQMEDPFGNLIGLRGSDAAVCEGTGGTAGRGVATPASSQEASALDGGRAPVTDR